MADPPPLSAEAESLVARFEAAWLAGGRPDLAAALDGCPPAERAALAREVAHADLEFRIKAGESAAAGDYLRRFPELAADPDAVAGLVVAEARLRAANRDSPTASHSGPADPTPPEFTRVQQDTTPDRPGGPRPPDRVGPYRVTARLGAGGMGVVYRAEDPHLKRPVAVKVLHPDLAADPAARARFVREAEAQAAVENDHVVPVYQVGQDGEAPYLVMPLLKGQSLDARLRGGKPFPAAAVAGLGRQVAEGLAAAHAAGLVHRDVKPSNVWLEAGPDGKVRRARVLDFGLARRPAGGDLTRSGVMIGTPAYMAPEQARGQPVDARADLFGLGCVLYQMATGRRPFDGPDVLAVLAAVAVDDPPPARALNPAVPPALSDLIARLLAKDPADRPGSAAEVSVALGQITADLPRPSDATPAAAVSLPTVAAITSTTATVPVAAASGSPPRRRRWGRVVAAVLALGLAGLLGANAGTVIRVVTNKGELVVEVDDPAVQVVVGPDWVVLDDTGPKRRYELRVGSEGTVEFRDPDTGATAKTAEFKIERGGRSVVRASRGELKAGPAPPFPFWNSWPPPRPPSRRSGWASGPSPAAPCWSRGSRRTPAGSGTSSHPSCGRWSSPATTCSCCPG